MRIMFHVINGWITYPTFIDLAEELKKDHEVVWSVPNVKDGNPETLVKYLLDKGENIDTPFDYKADVMFLADPRVYLNPQKATTINLGHGLGSKGIYYVNNPNFTSDENQIDICAVSSRNIKKKMSYLTTKVEVLGTPCMDRVFNKQYDREKILLDLGLDPNKKTVLFAPTFNQELTAENFVKEKDLEKLKDYNVIIKRHNIFENKLPKEYWNIAPLLFVSDIMIGDAASVYMAFAAQDKPVILVETSYVTENLSLFPNWNENMWWGIASAYIKGPNPDLNKIIDEIFKKDNKSIARLTCRDYLYDYRGESIKQIKKCLKKIFWKRFFRI